MADPSLKHSAPASSNRSNRRDGLTFATDDAVIAEIEHLRHGHTQHGQWTLAQMCWHLDATTRARMKPGPFDPNTPEQNACKSIFEQVLASGQLPKGLIAPDVLTPPADAGDEAIDAFLATLRQWNAFAGPAAPHRLFGHMTLELAKRHNRIHCANHLRYLSPHSQ